MSKPVANQVTEARPLVEETDIAGEAAEPGAPERVDTSGSRLFRNTVIYGAGMVLNRAASVIMLPVYTRLLTPSDYGLLQMLDITIEVLGLLVSAGCTLGIVRFYYKATTHEDRKIVVSTQYALHLGLNIIGTVVLAAAAVPIWKYGLSGAGKPSYVLIAAANFTLGALPIIPLSLMQIEQRAAMHSLTTLSKLVLQLTMNILFLVVFHTGPVGILISTGIANLIVGGAAGAWLIRRNGFKIRRDVLRDLRRFGLPYQIAAFGSFILTFGDRLFLEPMKGLAVVGIYSFAYQFGFLLDQIGTAPYTRAWGPTRWQIVNDAKEVRDAAYNTGAMHLSIILVTTAVGITLFVHPVLKLFASPAYQAAADLVPVILIAYVMQGWAVVAAFGIDVSEKTKYSSYSVWISTLVIIPLYAILIPPFAGYGAAIATAVSFAVRTVCLYVFAQRLFPIDYKIAPHFRLFGLASVVAVASHFIRPNGLVLEIAGLVVLLLVYAALAWSLVLDRELRESLVQWLASLRRGMLARFRAV